VLNSLLTDLRYVRSAHYRSYSVADPTTVPMHLTKLIRWQLGSHILKSLYFGWWRGSVVRTSVCSRRTFPNLRLIRG